VEHERIDQLRIVVDRVEGEDDNPLAVLELSWKSGRATVEVPTSAIHDSYEGAVYRLERVK
jgi:hypothetical protein